MSKKRTDNNMYERKISLGRDAEGKLVRKSVYASSKLELERKVFDLRQQYLALKTYPDADVSFKSYSEKWYNTYKAVRSINTRAMYYNVITKHLNPAIGDMYIGELTDMSVCQRIINAQSGHPETCRKIKMTLVQILDQAVRDGLISSHPMRSLSLPPTHRKEKRALTASEKNLLKSHGWTPKQQAFLYLAYYTGARREEILALQSRDVNLDAMTVSYNKTIVYDHGSAVLVNGTKAQASTRTVPLPTAASDFLRAYLQGMSPNDILFPMSSGSYMSLSSYTKFWESIRTEFAKADPASKDLTAHILRHTYATMLYYSGISVKKAAQLMGHANTNMIMRIYAHLDEEKEDSVSKLNKMFE